MTESCPCCSVMVVKNLNRWFKEKWVDVSRKDKDGKHPPCGRSKAKKGSKGYPKCRPSVKVSSKTPKTSGSMSEGQKRAATKRKRSKKQGVGGKPTIVKQVLLKKDPLHLQPSNTLARRAKEELETDMTGQNSPAYQEMMERMMEMYEPQDETTPLEENLDQYAQETGKNPWRMLPGREIPNKYGGTARVQLDPLTPIHPQQFYNWQAKNASEPMDITFQLLKNPVSPEAKRHKLEYDTKYESTPERVKYREELKRERRHRGIDGKGGPDMSHTKDHTLVAEDPHTNRARHFKERGTLKGDPMDIAWILVKGER